MSARHASRGFLFLAGQSLGTRGILFVSQIILSRIFDQSAFGAIGITTMITTIIWSVSGFGVGDVLVQRGRRAADWEAAAFRVAMLISIVTSIALLILAQPLSIIFHAPSTRLMISILSVCLVIESLFVVPLARLSRDLRFNVIAAGNLLDTFINQCLAIALALCGVGVTSVAIAGPFSMGARMLLYRRVAGASTTSRSHRRQYLYLLSSGAKIFGGKLAGSLVSQGDYLILSVLTNPSQVGLYFFAFRLAALPMRLVTVNLQGVLTPILSQIQDRSDARSLAAKRAIVILGNVVFPLSLLQAAILPMWIVTVFGPRWENSVGEIVILSLGLPFESLTTTVKAYQTASARYNEVLSLSWIQGILFLLGVASSTWLFGGFGTAISVAVISFLVFTMFGWFVLGRGFLPVVLKGVLAPFSISCVAIGVPYFGLRGSDWNLVAKTAAILFVSPLIWGGLVWLVTRSLLDEAKVIFRAFRRD